MYELAHIERSYSSPNSRDEENNGARFNYQTQLVCMFQLTRCTSYYLLPPVTHENNTAARRREAQLGVVVFFGEYCGDGGGSSQDLWCDFHKELLWFGRRWPSKMS